MTTVLASRALVSARLRPPHLALAMAGSVLLTATAFALTPLQGRAGFLVVLALAYSAVQTTLSYAVEGRRHAADRLFRLLVHYALAAALVPLVFVLGYTVLRGSRAISVGFLTHSMRGVGPLDTNGGIYHALIGTVEQVVLASLIAVPLGLLTAVYITEVGRGAFARVVQLVVDVMTGVPSIVAGLFIFAFWVLGLHRGFSGLAAALSLAILMLPVVVRSAEEMIRIVPDTLREASLALGVPRWRTTLSVVLPTASAGITTGVMLAIARVTGETAPLLLTSFGYDSINTDPLHGKQESLPRFIFDQASSSARGAVDRAWAAALTLIVIVLALYVVARLLTRRSRLQGNH